MTRTIPVGILVTLWLLGCASTPSQDEARARMHLQMGTSYLSAGNYPLALRELLEAETLSPNEPIIQNNLALAYLVRERFDLAEKHARRALELRPQYTEARNNLGRILIEARFYDQAISELQIANQDLTYPSPEQTLSNLGLAYLKKGEHASAADSFRRSLKIRRDNCQTLSYYGRALFELKKYSESAVAFDQAVRSCDEAKQASDEPYYYSGLSYWKLGDRERSLAKLHEVVELFPNGELAGKAKSIIDIINRAER